MGYSLVAVVNSVEQLLVSFTNDVMMSQGQDWIGKNGMCHKSILLEKVKSRSEKTNERRHKRGAKGGEEREDEEWEWKKGK